MPRIALIGNGLSAYGRELRSNGHTVRAFTTSEAFLGKSNNPDLAMIEASHKGKIRELKAAVKCLPKIIISDVSTNKKSSSWIKEPNAYMLTMPSPEDLAAFSDRIISEAHELMESRSTVKKVATLKAELNFFEDLNHAMSVSSDISDILPAIMKQATRITGAESWSVHLVNPDTNELNCAKTSGRLSKTCFPSIAAIAAWNVKYKKPVLVEDISRDKRFGPKTPKACSNRSVSIVGARIQGKTGIIGTLELLKGRSPFTKDDLDFLVKLAGRAALAIERTSLQQRLEELVVTDDLTNLFNTRYLTRSVETEMFRSRRYGHSLSVIFMDVDHFKDVNDTHGHLAGSKVLVEMAEILIRELRNIDIVARYGGDEFVMVLPQTSLDNAMAIAERIRESIEKHTFLRSEKLNLRLTSSFGVAAYPESAKNRDALMRIADESMYNVKRHTRNGVYAIIR